MQPSHQIQPSIPHNKLQIVSPALEPRAIEVAARHCGATQSVVSFIAKGNEMQIRKIRARGYDCFAEIQIEISQVAKDYGARNGLDPFVLDECTRFVLEKFPMIAIPEIRAAYRSWASGEIETGNAEMYGGTMDVRQLGKVLSAWVEYRNKIYFNYCKEAERIAAEKKEEEDKIFAAKYFAENFHSILEGYKAKVEKWDDVPVFLYDALIERGMIQFEDGERKRILAEATVIIAKQIEDARAESIGKPLKVYYADSLESSKEEHAKVVARKISVFRKVFNK